VDVEKDRLRADRIRVANDVVVGVDGFGVVTGGGEVVEIDGRAAEGQRVVTDPSVVFSSAGLEATEVVITSVPRLLTRAPTTTVDCCPPGKKSSGQVTVWPELVQPGPRSTTAPL
jgi:hypothetical protein